MDLNSFYTILNNIFGREQNENYTNRNRSAFASGLADLRNGWAAMQNNRLNDERKEKWSKKHNSGNRTEGTVTGGAGTFTLNNNGIDSMPEGYTVGSPIIANSVGVDNPVTTSQFNLLSNTVGGNQPTDWQRGQAANAIGAGSIGNFDRPSSSGFGSSILGASGGMNNSALNPVIDSRNFYSPTSDNKTVQSASGATGETPNNKYQQMIDALKSSQYLGDEYSMPRWLEDDWESGVTDPVISMLRYQTQVAPLVRQAREDRLRETYRIANDPNVDNATRTQALAALSYELKKPDLVNDIMRKGEEYENEKSMWDLNRLAKQLQIEGARESIADRRANRASQINLNDYASAFPDGKIYKVNMGEGYEDEGLKRTNPELVDGLHILNTFVRNKFGKDLTVTGGARTKEHNASVNGDPNSHHLYGEAVDLVDSGLTPEQQEEVVKFAKAIGFTAAKYHDAGSGNHLHVALDKGSHLKGLNIGKGKTITTAQMLGQTGKDSKGSKTSYAGYSGQKLADLINNTFTDGKTRATIDESNAIADEMKKIVPVLGATSPADAAEKLYEYYHNNGDKGWSLNSEAFSDIVGRAVYSYFNDMVGLEDKDKIPSAQQLSKHVYSKYDPQVQETRRKYEEAVKKNGGKLPTEEEIINASLGNKSQTASAQNGYSGGGSSSDRYEMENPWNILRRNGLYDTGG